MQEPEPSRCPLWGLTPLAFHRWEMQRAGWEEEELMPSPSVPLVYL